MKTLVFSLFCLLSQVQAQAASLAGTVQGKDGLPIAGAAVYLQGKEGILVTVSGLQGQYKFENLAAGSYLFKAYQGANSSLPKALLFTDHSKLSEKILLNKTESVHALSMKVRNLGQGSLLSLEYRLESPVAGSGMLLQDAQVSALLKTLAKGEYEVVLAKPGKAYVGTVLVLGEGSFVATSGEEIAGADFVEAISSQASLAESSPRL
jgi:hypothetical protein